MMPDNLTLWMLLLGVLIGILRSITSSLEPQESDQASATGFLLSCYLFFEDEE
jgi:hypothetical protein